MNGERERERERERQPRETKKRDYKREERERAENTVQEEIFVRNLISSFSLSNFLTKLNS